VYSGFRGSTEGKQPPLFSSVALKVKRYAAQNLPVAWLTLR
jgi:hypothetical protein